MKPPDMVRLGHLIRAEDWPNGLRCGECSVVLKPGQRYRHRDDGFAGDGLPIKLVVCVTCAMLGR